MVKHMEYLVHSENRPFWYDDFRVFEVEGKRYGMKHGTFRNKILTLKKAGKVELDCNSGTAFYTLKGRRFGKPMTPIHAGVYNSKMDSFARFIHNLPTETPAAHNIRLRFQVHGIWAKLSSAHREIPTNQRSKDICIPTRPIGDLLVRTTVHKSNTVSVIVSCSVVPVTLNFDGLIELSDALTRIHEMLYVIVNEINYCRSDQFFSNDSRFKDSGGNGGHLLIPDPKHWVITMWHVGVDSLDEYLGGKIDLEWKDAQHALIRVYTKKMKDKKSRIRLESQEYPRKSLQAAVAERIGLGGW
jgi:hypothetical protein